MHLTEKAFFTKYALSVAARIQYIHSYVKTARMNYKNIIL